MKKILLSLMVLPLLAGCLTTPIKPDEPVAVRYKYVVTSIPDNLFKAPSPMYKIDPKTATDKELAKWLTDSENRYLEIEKRLKAVKLYQEQKVKDLKIPEADLVRN